MSGPPWTAIDFAATFQPIRLRSLAAARRCVRLVRRPAVATRRNATAVALLLFASLLSGVAVGTSGVPAAAAAHVEVRSPPEPPVFGLPSPGTPEAQDGGGENAFRRIVEAQWEILDTDAIDELIGSLDPDAQRFLRANGLRQWVRDPLQGPPLSLSDLGEAITHSLVGEVRGSSWLLGQLILLAVLSGLLQHLSRGFGKGAEEIAFWVALLGVVYLGVESFRHVAAIAQGTMDDMLSLMYALLPTLSVLVSASGGITSAALLHPVMLASVTAVATVMGKVVLPLSLAAGIVGMVGQVASGFPISKLAELGRQLAAGVIGLLFTLFMGVITVRGIVAPVADGVAIRTAKFLSGTFVPVVGGFLADTAELVAGSSLLLKSVVGAAGLGLILLAVAFPVVKILAILVVYKLAGAVIQPISDARVVDAIGQLAGGMTLVFVSVLVTALMFFLTVVILAGAGNIATYVR